MAFTTFWSPNQSAIAQVETYTFSAPNGVGNTYNATINGKTATYASVSGDTAALAAAGLLAVLNASDISELDEISFSAGAATNQMVATASEAGVPFANVPGTTAGLVLSTGNGLANGITTVHTQANQSPSDINDAQNWLRVNTGVIPPAATRSLPQNADNVVVANSSVPLLWNADQLAAVQFNTYTRWQSFTGQIGLPSTNANGYAEWRAKHFKFSGPQGSVPAGGLQMVLGYNTGSGSGPTLERYNVGSQQTTLVCLAAGNPSGQYGIEFLGVHTLNTFTALGAVNLAIAMNPGEVANLNSSLVDGSATVSIGPGVTWTAGAVLTTVGGSALLNSAPPSILGSGTSFTFATDQLTWPLITLQKSCPMTWLCGGVITALNMTTSSSLDKSQDARPLIITNHNMDGDTCFINDPLGAITFTNAGTVKQNVTSGPYRFTGPRTVKLT